MSLQQDDPIVKSHFEAVFCGWIRDGGQIESGILGGGAVEYMF
jgi:hypothetical protein